MADAAASSRVFPATLDEYPRIVDFVGEKAAAAGVPQKRLPHLRLAVEEAVVNICHYAYHTQPGEIEVQVEHAEGKFIVRLIDNGVPFDPLAAEEPDITLSIDKRQSGGLGIFLIRRMMDDVQYERNAEQNILTLVLRTDT